MSLLEYSELVVSSTGGESKHVMEIAVRGVVAVRTYPRSHAPLPSDFAR